MTMTTKDGTKIGQNVVTDINVGSDPNANQVVPKSEVRYISPEAALLLNKSIVAKPLGVPQVCDVRIKNNEYRYRWVNRDGQGGRVYMMRRAQGFLNATSSDVEVMGGDATVGGGGEIRAGDLILMKIRADLYDAAIKANMVKAMTLANARGFYTEGASSDVFSDAQPSRKTVSSEPGARTGMAKAFIPDNADALVNDSISSGRVEQTRATMDEMRSHNETSK